MHERELKRLVACIPLNKGSNLVHPDFYALYWCVSVVFDSSEY